MNFYVTFGQKYRHEPHPQGYHPHGWLRIEAPNADYARAMAFDYMGPHWAMIYTEDEFSREYYPTGEFAVLSYRPPVIAANRKDSK